MHIFSVNGVSGSLKTTRALEYAFQAAQRGSKFVIASPSVNLIGQSYENGKKLGADCHRFDSASHPDAVYADLCAFMKEKHEGCLVFVTHKCLFDLPYWGPHKGDWHLIVDEIPQIDRDWSWNLAHERTTRFILEPLTVRDVGHNLYLRLVVKDGHESWIKRIATDNDDTILQWMHEYRDLAQCLRSEHTEVWVSRASWNQLKYRRQGKLHIHAVLRPAALNGWASVQMMGAHFDDSVLKLVWEKQGISFAPSKRIVADRASHEAALTKRIRLYSIGDKRWSKKLFAKLGEHQHVDEAAVAALHPTIEKVVGSDPFLYALNNDLDGKTMERRFPSARRVPNNPHGLNHFQDYTKAVFLTCLNNRSPHFAFLKEMYGVVPEQLAKARYYEYAYQFFMRSAARAKASTETCHFVIPDADAADHFAKNVFPGCTWTALEVPREIEEVLGSSACGRNKTRRKAGRPKAEQVKPQSVLDRESRAKRRDMESMKMGIGIYLFSSTSDVRLTHEADVRSMDLMANSIATWDDFRAQMRHLADQFCPKKEEATLVSGASFAPLLGESTVKGLKNIADVNGIWFDVDDGEMQAEDWRTIFPECKLLAFNSFNNGKDGKLKYRVVFPTVEAIGASEYHYVWDRMIARVRQAGFYVGRRQDYERVATTDGSQVRFSGIDMSKRTANSFFYLPSRAGKGKRYSFWFENWGDDAGILDPLVFLDYPALERPEYETEAPYENPNDRMRKMREKLAEQSDHDDVVVDLTARRIAAALDRWRRGKPGHPEMLALARSLAPHIDQTELLRILRQEAERDHDSNRRREAASIAAWAMRR